MAESKVRLKLLINTVNRKVLFAEAGKDFVDFLFYLFSLPLGTVVKLLTKESMVGCLGELYQSIETLNETYMQPNQDKSSVLNPKSPMPPTESKIPLLISDNESKARNFYGCRNYSNGHYYVTDVQNVPCPSCNANMNRSMSYVSPAARKTGTAAEEGGFVKGVVTYMVMDNLEVMPMSTISCITLLNKFNVKDLGALEERCGLKLLKESLGCKSVLTSVYLGKEKA